jgi:DNA (cytosine-5)-methyltransferase 1
MSTGIEWTGETWNPLVGCTKVSPGCKHCYAETMAKRLAAMGDGEGERRGWGPDNQDGGRGQCASAGSGAGGGSDGVQHAEGDGWNERRTESGGGRLAGGLLAGAGGVPDADDVEPGATRCGFWSDYDILPFRDGKARRVESGTQPLADGVPGRVGLLRGYGNAIVPQVAAEFIGAYLDMKRNEVAA